MEALEEQSNRPEFGFAQISGSAFGTQSNFNEALTKAQRYLDLESSEQMPDGEVPKEWDWSDVDGVDFTGRDVDQKGCGSCYMVATNTMLESRIKIWYGEERELSTQMPLQCNFLTEGCHGGWGLLYGLFL